MPAKSNSDAPIRVSEVQRARAVYRYLPPFAASLIPPPKNNGDISKSPRLSPKAFSSSDRALNAFAQLGALRLRARRAMISLVDSTHEYILAESTRTLSPQDDDVHDAGDSLWLGVRTIPREESLCAAVINTPRSKGKRNDTESRPKVIPKVINDLADDETLMYDRNIIGGPKIRFVATVPIRSRLGYDIGAYSVFDDVPRNGLIIEELEFLTDIADTVMEHLENITVKRDHQRGEKMVKGLGLFVEGHSSIKSWWLRTRHNRQTSVRGDHPYAARSVENAINRTDASDAASDKASIEANLSYVEETQELDVPMSQIPAPTPLLTINAGMPIKLQREDDQPFDHSSSRVKGDLPRSKETIDRSTALAPVGNAAKLPVSVPSEHPKPAPTVPSETHLPIINKNDQSGETPTRNRSPNVTEDLRKMLSRASNLIRESTDVEGVVFFDAKTSGFGSRGRQTFIKPERASHLHDAARTSSSDDDPRTSLRNETSDSSNGKRLHKESKEVIESSQPSLCEVMAYSTASKCSLCGDQSMPEHLTVTENFVRRLFKQHPHGKIYAFDDEGNMSSSEDELHDAAPEGEMAVIAETPQSPSIKKASSRISEGQTMMQIFPGARYVMILPLWDSQRERWFASTMLWTSDPTRVLSLDDDLNYVAAFGNSIMAEVSRLDIVASDQKKTALISSISHELRSPLHGIASGIELLQDTQINKYQMDVVNTIGHCSTTLLDTLNNVLDYAKINNFTTAQKTEERAIHNSSRAREAVPSEKFRIYGTISLTSNLDIACITEDVINGIYAGHVYALQSTSPVSADIDYPISPTKLDTYITQEMLPLSVILEVEHKSNWTFLTQPGAWKRIIMNIFGNALKFTSSGLVKVSMSYKNATSSKSRMNQAFVTLTISDTGRGIDADFLKHQIYSPFAQEDSLTPGAGLGLSIVRQIVGALDGKIEVHSVQNIGTVVKVVLKLEKSQSPTDGKPLVPSTIQQARTYTQGLELVLIGLELSTPEPEETADLRAKRRDSVGPTIARLSKNWFGMKTSEAAGFEKSIGDVFLITSERFYELEDSWKSLYAEALSNSRKKHVIVLTGSAQSERKTLFENYQNIHFLSNPIGPKKLADCFISMFENSSGQNDIRFLTMPLNPRRRTSPYETQSEASPAEDPPHPDVPVPDKPIALLVEDNPINMKILIACMKKLNTQYCCAVNGLLAVNIYKSVKKKPDVVFMDISMPVMNGFEASQRIRAFEKQENLEACFIVAVTGLASDESQREAYNSGINLFMSKPVPLKDLSRIVVDLEKNRSLSTG